MATSKAILAPAGQAFPSWAGYSQAADSDSFLAGFGPTAASRRPPTAQDWPGLPAAAMALAARVPLQAGDPVRVGRYRLTARLGSGGMGVVYLGVAEDGRLVAVKLIRPELADDPEFRARFSREVAVLARVRGAYTVRVIEAGTDACGPYLVTEYAAGPTLAAYIDQAGPLGPGMLHSLARGLAEALSVIHAAGVVHRDLKPSNVILTNDGPKVIDFGIAQALDSVSLTRTGATVGSPGFMAPEQVGGQAGPAADVFAWALTIAYAASGRPPFGTGPTDAVVYRVMHAQPSIAEVPDVLRPVIEAALAKNPPGRPAAHEILDWLAVSPAAPAPVHPAPAAPAPHRRLTGRRAAIAAPVLAVIAIAALAGALLTGHVSPAPRLAGDQGGMQAVPPAAVLATYPGQQTRGVFGSISRIVSSGTTVVTTGAQVSDGIVRQQFFTSTNDGATWRLAPVTGPGGGLPPLGYQATRLAAGPHGWVAIGTAGAQATWTSRTGQAWTLAATHGITPQLPGDSVGSSPAPPRASWPPAPPGPPAVRPRPSSGPRRTA